MNEEQLLKVHRDPLDPWEPAHTAARIINNQVALYPHNHDSALAARQLDALTPYNRVLKPDEQPEDIESFLWEFWEVVVNLSQTYEQNGDQAQTCIVEIIGELKKIEAQEVTIWGKQTRLWGNLPIFGPVLTELYGKCASQYPWLLLDYRHAAHRAFCSPINIKIKIPGHQTATTTMPEPAQRVKVDPSLSPTHGSCKITQLPDEVALNILNNITRKADLLNVMVTCKHLRDPAETILWKVCHTRGYEKLLSIIPAEQSHHKTKVHTLLLDFQDNGLQPGDLELHLPCLRGLAIFHSSRNTLDVQVNVSKLVTPNLKRLRIVQGSTDNFLPALRQAKDLEVFSLEPCVKVNEADPISFLRLVRTMPRLSTLDAGVLASSGLLDEMAGRGLIALHLAGASISVSQITRTLQMPQPFSRLEDLATTMQAKAAVLLLGKLPQLKKLELLVTPELSFGETHVSAVVAVIQAVAVKTELLVLWLDFNNINITIDIKELAPLKNLTHFEYFAFTHRFIVRHRATDDLQPFSSLCPLRVLFLRSLNMTIGNYFDRIARNHPNLQRLIYSRQLNLSQMSAQFPSLEKLEVSATDMPLTESTADTTIRTLATRLVAVAPKIKQFYISRFVAPTTEIRFEHRLNSIVCTCRHPWNDNVTFSI
ncbi:hypothetical protein KCU74_g2035, partial [Aureobasidium melanogenum]